MVTKKKPQHIISLEVENFKRIKAFKIEPGGNHVKIGGRNNQGKSTALDSVQAAFGGKKAWPKDAVHHGADEARILLKTDKWIISVVGDNSTRKLKITDHDGSKLAEMSSQSMLDDVYETLTSDPTDFMRKPAPEQVAILRKLIGLDLEKEKAARKKAYDERTIVGRDVKRLEGALAEMPKAPDDTPDEEISADEVRHDLEVAMGHRSAKSAKESDISNLRAEAVLTTEKIGDLQSQLAAAKKALEEINERGVAWAKELAAMPKPDVDKAQEKLGSMETTNTAVRQKQARATTLAELTGYREQQDALTERLEEIDQLMSDATNSAVYPIDGLRAEDDGVIFNDVPLKQASDSEQIRVSAAICLALKPEVRILLVRMGSLLDEDSERELLCVADEADAQVMQEVVSKDGEGCTVFIENGQNKV